jgi:hypothetical protein
MRRSTYAHDRLYIRRVANGYVVMMRSESPGSLPEKEWVAETAAELGSLITSLMVEEV